jgi:hypothetical protein
MSNKYRFDNRSKKEFISDIKKSHRTEAEIAIRIGIFHYRKTGRWLEIVPNGTDFSGEFVENANVTGDPDFLIDGISTEITRADTFCKDFFHQKIPKINKCIKENSNIVFVNGFKVQKEPKFILLKPKSIEKATEKAIKKYGEIKHPGTGNKKGYRYDNIWFAGSWQILPKLIKEIPEEYKQLLQMVQ